MVAVVLDITLQEIQVDEADSFMALLLLVILLIHGLVQVTEQHGLVVELQELTQRVVLVLVVEVLVLLILRILEDIKVVRDLFVFDIRLPQLVVQKQLVV